jgi:hypothetical protein
MVHGNFYFFTIDISKKEPGTLVPSKPKSSFWRGLMAFFIANEPTRDFIAQNQSG